MHVREGEYVNIRRSTFGGESVEAERRQVTIVFADMVDFTAFSERSGEEAAFTLMRSLSKLMDDAGHERAARSPPAPTTPKPRNASSVDRRA
jgi:class 3 adenylate cyclase